MESTHTSPPSGPYPAALSGEQSVVVAAGVQRCVARRMVTAAVLALSGVAMAVGAVLLILSPWSDVGVVVGVILFGLIGGFTLAVASAGRLVILARRRRILRGREWFVCRAEAIAMPIGPLKATAVAVFDEADDVAIVVWPETIGRRSIRRLVQREGFVLQAGQRPGRAFDGPIYAGLSGAPVYANSQGALSPGIQAWWDAKVIERIAGR